LGFFHLPTFVSQTISTGKINEIIASKKVKIGYLGMTGNCAVEIEEFHAKKSVGVNTSLA